MFLRRLLTWFYICAAFAAVVYMYWPAVRFSYPLASALQLGTIDKIEVLKCPGGRASLLEVGNKKDDIDFYKQASDAAADIRQWCDKRSVATSSIMEAVGDSTHFPLVRYSHWPMMVTDAIFLYDTSEDNTYAIYYWQYNGNVSVSVWKGKLGNSSPLYRFVVGSNKFTDTLYDKFILEKPPQ